MKIKRYVVREMQEAIRLIKTDLGPEAVIISSYKVPAKGVLGLFSPRLLEVTAALDDTPEISLRVGTPPAQMALEHENNLVRLPGPYRGPERALKSVRQSEPMGRTMYLPRGTTFKGPQEAAVDSGQARKDGIRIETKIIEANKLKQEKLRCLFDMMQDNEPKASSYNDPVDFWFDKLLELNVDEKIAGHLTAACNGGQDGSSQDPQYLYLDLLRQVCRLLETAYNISGKARIKTFIGPPGVGKTTTLAKLAARSNLIQNKKIALIAIYTYRIGAVEHLRAYGDFLGLPVEVVMTPAELVGVLESHKDKDLIYIDTNGRSHRKAEQLLELKSFLDVVNEPKDVYLVLDSAMKDVDLARCAGEFQQVGYSKLIFTKIDQTETLGSILNVVSTLGIPASYLSDGQGVPDDIIEASPMKIAQLLFRGVDPDEAVAVRFKQDLPGRAI